MHASDRAHLDFADPSTLVDYAKSLDCIHCGLCLTSCPTYRLTGVESSSPRGRIHLMRGVAEGRLEPDAGYRQELDFCLLCRHCESVCPAGVQFGALMEHARDAAPSPRGPAARLARWLGLRVLLPSRPLLSAARVVTFALQRSGLARVCVVFGGLGRALATLPPVAFRRRTPRRAGTADGEPVLALEGCVLPEVFPEVARDTLTTLGCAGCAVEWLQGVTCCGSLNAHNGDLDGARRAARALIEALEASGDERPLVVNSAGCSAHMKELAQLFGPSDPWHARAQRASARVHDYTEFLAQRLDALPPLQWRGAGPLAWDDPCHLCHGQGIRSEPRRVLAALGAPLVTLAGSESCCGSAGLYAVLRPADAAAVFAEKRAAFEASGARVLVTANPGCQLQWRAGLADLDVRVLHLASVVAAALPSDELAD
ncbi:MAG: heterodisulfide reductase-related iron-sulfur binding cluster [Planctomycetota bacterium]